MKLLNRTLRGFLIYSVILVLVVTPVLYLVVDYIITSNVDETLRHHKKEITERMEKENITHFEDLDGEVTVKPLEGSPVPDILYTQHHHRILKGSAEINEKLYSIEARVSLVESEDLISALVLIQVMVLVLLITGMLLINYWNSRTVWRPFYNTLNELKSFEIEKGKPITLPVTHIAEFNDLNAAIDELTKRDQQAFASQREFTENASHEMQTPLAIIQSKLDILLQTHPSVEQAPIIESLFDATRRLSRLNKSLLLLAKIDNRQYYETEEVEVLSATERLTMDTRINIKGVKLLVKMNPDLLDVLLSNLILNAVRYGVPSKAIDVNITETTWSISNFGEPLSISAERIFDRFQKSSSRKDSLGLGLAIAKTICDVNGLTLTYAFNSSIHRFEIQFPESKISTKSLR